MKTKQLHKLYLEKIRKQSKILVEQKINKKNITNYKLWKK